MSVRTSGYFKQKGIGEELVDNSDFEEGMENWIWYGWNKVEWIDNYHNEPALKCTFKTVIDNIRYKPIIEVNPEDILLMGITIEEPSTSHPVRFGLYRYDKFGYHIGSDEWYYKVTPSSATCTSVYRLFAISEQLSKYEGWQNVIRGVRPAIMCYNTDGWNDNDVLNIKSISLRRIKPDDLKVLPIELVKKWVTSGVNKGTYYGDEYFSGIFKEGDYVLYINSIEDAGEGGLTFSCSIQSYDIVSDKWYDAVVFDDVTIEAEVSNKTYTKIATAGLGMKQRVKWSLSGSGTPGVVKFKVGVTYKQ